MIKKILKVLGSFLLVLCILISILFVWAYTQKSKYAEIIDPYIANNFESIVSWDYELLSPLLTDEAKEQFETETGQKTIKFLSRLGEIKSYDDPEFQKSSRGASVSDGSYEIAIYLVNAQFEEGDAQVSLTFKIYNDEVMLHHLKVNSNVFLD